MKSAVESVSPTRARLTVEVPFDELAPSLDAAYKKIAKQINVPGFRRGKVPPVVIDRQVGRGVVLDEAINEAVPQKYLQAVADNSLEPVARPEIEVTRFADHEGLEFTAEVDVKPEITLPAYDGLEAEVDDLVVTDEDVDEEMDRLRERFATLVDVDRAAGDGDFVVIDMVATRDGEVVEGAEVAGMSYEVGRGGMIDGLDQALLGMAAGDRRTFSSQLVGGELVGVDAEVAVTVTQVQEQQLPVFDDEFAQLASEFDTAEELRADVRERLLRAGRLHQAQAARDAVLQKLLERVDVPLPEGLVTDEMNSRREETERQMVGAGMTLEQYLEEAGQTIEDFEADLERHVRDSVAAQFLLEEVAGAENLAVEQQELSQHLVRRAQQSGQDPQAFVDHMLEHNHLPELAGEVLRNKALAHLVGAATVRDSSGRILELDRLRPDGTLGDPPAAPQPVVAAGPDPQAESATGSAPAAVEQPADDESSTTR